MFFLLNVCWVDNSSSCSVWKQVLCVCVCVCVCFIVTLTFLSPGGKLTFLSPGGKSLLMLVPFCAGDKLERNAQDSSRVQPLPASHGLDRAAVLWPRGAPGLERSQWNQGPPFLWRDQLWDSAETTPSLRPQHSLCHRHLQLRPRRPGQTSQQWFRGEQKSREIGERKAPRTCFLRVHLSPIFWWRWASHGINFRGSRFKLSSIRLTQSGMNISCSCVETQAVITLRSLTLWWNAWTVSVCALQWCW